MCVSSLQKERSGERGSIIIMTAIFALLLLLMVGLCIDVSRLYTVRAELQNAADAAALAAARELNGGTGGIDDAVAGGQCPPQHPGTSGKDRGGHRVGRIRRQPYDDPYLSATAAKANARSNIRFVKVTTQPTSTNILFASSALGVSNAQSREAIAGMSVELDAASATSSPPPSV